MSKLILLACPVMYGVGLRNETRQGSGKNVFSCLLLNNLFKELRLSGVIPNASCSFKIVSAGDWRTIDKHTGVYLTWQLQKVCVWMPSAAHTLTLMTDSTDCHDTMTLDSPTSARGAPQIATCSVGNTDITLINRTLTSQGLKSYLCSKNGDNLINKTLPDQLVIGVNVDKRQWSWDRVCPSGNACQLDYSWDDACSINTLQGWLDSTPCDTVSHGL